MKRVTGIGGIFFKAKDAPALQAWYRRHLGIDVQEWGGTAFRWTDGEGQAVGGTTIWSIGAVGGDPFAPSQASFMVNYRVEDVRALASVLRPKAATCSTGSMSRSTGCSRGSSIPRATRSNSGSRRLVNDPSRGVAS